jgi:RNA polymerase sigma factor (sigma-70 family)
VEVAVADLHLDAVLPVAQDLAVRKAGAFARRRAMPVDEREDVESQLLLTFLVRWSKFDDSRASARTFASRVMDKELASILRYRQAQRRRPQDVPVIVGGPSAAARQQFRIDIAKALASLSGPVKQTATALSLLSTVEVAASLRCSRQTVTKRKQQIRRALLSAGIGPDYFRPAGGAR